MTAENGSFLTQIASEQGCYGSNKKSLSPSEEILQFEEINKSDLGIVPEFPLEFVNTNKKYNGQQ